VQKCDCDVRYPPDHLKPCDFCRFAWIQADEKPAKKKKPVPMRGGGLPKQMKKGGDTGMSLKQLRAAAKEKGYTLKKDS